MRTKLSPRMETKLSPNLVMAGQLLQVSEAGLEQLICRELANNPALELVNDSQPSYFGFAPDGSPNSTSDWSGSQSQDAAEQVAAWPSAIDQLEIQARLTAAGPDLDMAVYLLHSLDERGYLATDIEELAVELGISTEVVEQGLHILHQLGPPGIGARNLRECLLIQCADLEAEGIDCQIVRGILTNAWDDFIHQRWGRVARHLSLPEGAVVAAWQFVARNLYPHPLTLVATTSAGQEAFLRPDLIIHCELQDGQPFYQLEIPAATVWELRVSECFAVALRTEADDESSLSNGEKAWIRSHLECARLFINALGQRWATLRLAWTQWGSIGLCQGLLVGRAESVPPFFLF